MKVEIADAMLEEARVAQQMALGEILELADALHFFAHRADGADQLHYFFLRRRTHGENRDEGDDLLAKFERIARPVLAAIGAEILADAREEEIDFVAAIAVDAAGMEVVLDQMMDDRVVGAFQSLEEAAQ